MTNLLCDGLILAQGNDAAAGVFGLVCMGLVLLIQIPLLIFWVWMVVDCIKNEPSEGNDKIIWILVVILAGVIGAAIYYFVRRPQRMSKFGR